MSALDFHELVAHARNAPTDQLAAFYARRVGEMSFRSAGADPCPFDAASEPALIKAWGEGYDLAQDKWWAGVKGGGAEATHAARSAEHIESGEEDA